MWKLELEDSSSGGCPLAVRTPARRSGEMLHALQGADRTYHVTSTAVAEGSDLNLTVLRKMFSQHIYGTNQCSVS